MQRLRVSFQPEAMPEDAELARYVRTQPPDMALLFVHPLHPAHAYRACRRLKTGNRPIERVGVVNIGGPPRTPETVVEFDLADGYFEGPLNLELLYEFAGQLWEGKKPFFIAKRPEGLLNRLLRSFAR